MGFIEYQEGAPEAGLFEFKDFPGREEVVKLWVAAGKVWNPRVVVERRDRKAGGIDERWLARA